MDHHRVDCSRNRNGDPAMVGGSRKAEWAFTDDARNSAACRRTCGPPPARFCAGDVVTCLVGGFAPVLGSGSLARAIDCRT